MFLRRFILRTGGPRKFVFWGHIVFERSITPPSVFLNGMNILYFREKLLSWKATNVLRLKIKTDTDAYSAHFFLLPDWLHQFGYLREHREHQGGLYIWRGP